MSGRDTHARRAAFEAPFVTQGKQAEEARYLHLSPLE